MASRKSESTPFETVGILHVHGNGDAGVGGHWGIVAEKAIEIGFNGKPAAVMMATPDDLEDFAIGFALTEELVASPGAVTEITTKIYPEGIAVDLTVSEKGFREGNLRKRMLEGRTGCGLCGVENLSDAVRKPRQAPLARKFEPNAILTAFRGLPSRQPLNKATRSAHAAALCKATGEIRLAREDVGRHNALDKLIGAAARQGLDFADSFIILSSRCSFELVQKAAVAGVPFLATVSAPTTAALELAGHADLRLACLDGDDVVLFTEDVE